MTEGTVTSGLYDQMSLYTCTKNVYD